MNTTTDQHFLSIAPVENGVYILCDPPPFELLYEKARSAERRVLEDQQVSQLPDGSALWNAREWRIRERSADRLVRSLRTTASGTKVLDVGCGNGWLSARLQQNGFDVVGVDLFTAELEQAARVFEAGPRFARADLFHAALPKGGFDVVVFAACIQYFPDPARTLARAKELLRAEGQIHVMDSILYRSSAETTAAKERSREYYEGIGVPEMTAYYHAHTMEDLRKAGQIRILSAPSGMDRTLRRFGKEASPFTHVVIGSQ
jgi:2-polyprenyl-3-methyl-5-hydroxy-6-metoxy-1,4-benzoquinol methylase